MREQGAYKLTMKEVAFSVFVSIDRLQKRGAGQPELTGKFKSDRDRRSAPSGSKGAGGDLGAALPPAV